MKQRAQSWTSCHSHFAAATRARQRDFEDRWAATALDATDLLEDSTGERLLPRPLVVVAAAARVKNSQSSVLSYCSLDFVADVVVPVAVAAVAAELVEPVGADKLGRCSTTAAGVTAEAVEAAPVVGQTANVAAAGD